MSDLNSMYELRWDPYFMKSGDDFEVFWQEYLADRNRRLLYVLGSGFDPRMCLGLQKILSVSSDITCHCLLIEYEEGLNTPSEQYRDLMLNNKQLLESLLEQRGTMEVRTIRMWSNDGLSRRRISSVSASNVFTQPSDFGDFTDIVIDISAMPRSIYLPLIGKVIHLSDTVMVNLHVVVAEDVDVDQRILDIGVDETANYIHTLGRDLENQSTEGIPKIWIPILGENQHIQLERIRNYVTPDEVCPVLPWPSKYPRRADTLLLSYREILFDLWNIEPQNIVYVSERNPFQVYRQIHQAVQHYNSALKPLGGCKTAISAYLANYCQSVPC